MGVGLVAMALGLAGCATGGAPPESTVTCLTGTVGTTGPGPTPDPILRPDDGEPVRLAGDLAEVARRLTGTVLELCGRTGVVDGVWSLSVQELALRSVDGMVAHLGVLDREAGDWVVRQDGGPGIVPLVPATVPGQLSDERGNLVWVAGRWDGPRFAVLSYGVIR